MIVCHFGFGSVQYGSEYGGSRCIRIRTYTLVVACMQPFRECGSSYRRLELCSSRPCQFCPRALQSSKRATWQYDASMDFNFACQELMRKHYSLLATCRFCRHRPSIHGSRGINCRDHCCPKPFKQTRTRQDSVATYTFTLVILIWTLHQ